MRVWPGSPYPLGATWDGRGVNFALFSENAEKVELCLFEGPDAPREVARIELPEYGDHIFHGFLPDVRPGQVYGYRVHGPWDPQNGHRFNPHKVLVDPYAKTVLRPTRWDDSMFAYRVGHPDEDLSFDEHDNASNAPLGAVVDQTYPWGEDRPPRIPWNKTIIYETHVKGLTARHPGVPEELRGTYAGLASEPVIRHLQELGVTSVELMPIHHRVDDRHLVERGLSNYWGYNTLAFFAPDSRYASVRGGAEVVREFKMMVRELHAAGLEVILDVVYNHTAEGNHLGPTLSLRGIDNASYYRLVQDDRRYYMDFTGCGNTLNMQHPQVLRLIMDSLRYWILEMHVDGFRFDLASALARELYDVDKLGAFFDIIHQDPVISQAKLIAEPWDLGHGGYQVGQFPVLWTEWNGRYRDVVRSFWNEGGCQLNEMATRLAGSSDLYEHTGRRPHASINFVTCHDGFTLRDLVSYASKHNEANGEDNRDGESHNRSANFGHEGSTDDPVIGGLRRQQMRNFMSTLLFSLGVPMISGGDEVGRTQRGNNNAYCQDNEISWHDWDLDEEAIEMLRFTRRVIDIRRNQPVFHRRSFFEGRSSDELGDVKDIYWLTPEAREMGAEDWENPRQCSLGIMLSGEAIDELDAKGRRITGDNLLLLINADHERRVNFTLAGQHGVARWERLLDTARVQPVQERRRFWRRGERYGMEPMSLVLFRAEVREGSG